MWETQATPFPRPDEQQQKERAPVITTEAPKDTPASVEKNLIKPISTGVSICDITRRRPRPESSSIHKQTNRAAVSDARDPH